MSTAKSVPSETHTVQGDLAIEHWQADIVCRYTHDGSFLAFVNGDDPDFKGQAQHWADDSNCYVRSTDPEVPLPSCSWPPNFYLASPDQQRYINVEKVLRAAS